MNTIIYYVSPDSIPDSFNTTPFQRLLQLGKAFRVILLTYPDSLVPDEIEEAVTVRRCPVVKSFFSGIAYYLWSIYQIRSGGKENDRFFVLCCSALISMFTGLSASLFSSGKCMLLMDIWDEVDKSFQLLRNMKRSKPRFPIYQYYYFKGTLKNVFAHLILPQADLIICSMVIGAMDRYHLNARKILYVTNGVAIKRIKAGNYHQRMDQSFNILYLGPIVEARLIEDVCEAAFRLGSIIPGLRVTLAGGMVFKTDYEWFDAILKDYSGGKNIQYLGQISHSQALSLIVEADLCLCLLANQRHYDYAYPIKIFEYQAMGRLVLASALKGVRQIIRHLENGYLIESGDKESLIKGIRFLFENPVICDQLVKNAQRDVVQYDWDKIHREIIGRISQLAKARIKPCN